VLPAGSVNVVAAITILAVVMMMMICDFLSFQPPECSEGSALNLPQQCFNVRKLRMQSSCPGLWHQNLQGHMKVKKGLGSCWRVAVGRQMQSWCDHFQTAWQELLLEPAVI